MNEPPVTRDDLRRLELKMNGFSVPLREYLDDKFSALALETKVAREGIDFRCQLRHGTLDRKDEKLEERIATLELSEAKLAGKASIKAAIFIGFIPATASPAQAFQLDNDIDTYTIRAMTYDHETGRAALELGRQSHSMPVILNRLAAMAR